MKLPFEQFKLKAVEYIIDKVMPQIPSTSDRFLLGVGLGPKLAESLAMLQELGAADGEGVVDTDRLSEALLMGFKCVPDGKARFAHPRLQTALTFTVKDWDEFHARLASAAR